MMRKSGKLLSVLLAAAMTLSMSAPSLASASYDYTAESAYGGQLLQDGSELYPGDKVYGEVNIYLGEENAASQMPEDMSVDEAGCSFWKNTGAAVYTVKDVTPSDGGDSVDQPQTDENGQQVYDENGNPVMETVTSPATPSYELDVKGYTVEAVNGTLSDGAGTWDNVQSVSLPAADGSTAEATPSARYYSEGSTVTVTASDPQDGRKFSSWSIYQIEEDGTASAVSDVSSLNLGLSSDSLAAPDLTFTMGQISRVLVFSANFAVPETQAPETTAPETQTPETAAPETTAPETQAPETQAPETAAPETSAPETQDPETAAPETAAAVQINIQSATSDGFDGFQSFAYSDGFTQMINTAASKEDGLVFSYWETDDVTGAVNIEDPYSPSTTLTFNYAPASDVNIAAIYSEAPQDDPAVSGGTISVVNNDENALVTLADSNGTAIEEGAVVAEGTEVTATVQNFSDAASEVSVTTGDGQTVQTADSEDGTTVTSTFAMPAMDVVLTANAGEAPAAETYSVTASDSSDANVTLTFSDAEGNELDASAVPEGTQVVLSLSGAEGAEYSLSAADETGADVELTDMGDGTWSFTMPSSNVSITAVEKETEAPQPVLHKITVDSSAAQCSSMSISVNGADVTGQEIEAAAGDTVTLTLKSLEGYENTVTVDGAEVQAAAGADALTKTYTFTMPDADAKAVITGSKTIVTGKISLTVSDPYAHVTVTDADGKEITSANEGDKVYITFSNTTGTDAFAITSADGKQLTLTDASSGAAVTIAPVSEGAKYFFVMPGADVAISVKAAKTNKVSVDIRNGVFGQNSNNAALYVAGDWFEVNADTAPDGKKFSGWTVSGSNTDAVKLEDPSSELTTVTIASPLTASADVVLTANYSNVKVTYTLKVTNGTGSGTYDSGTAVPVKAAAAQSGYVFSEWTIVSGKGTFADAKAASTTFTPASNAEIKANYVQAGYKITVTNGKGSGTYTTGQTVSLEANFPETGKEFDKWAVTSGDVEIADAGAFYTTAKVKSSDASISAVYKDGPSADSNQITGLEDGKEYLKGTTLTFNAVGAGMDNSRPNPGDYRYRPTGYQINSVTGSWSASPYTTSMAINANGDYTLTVTYAKDVYDGNKWNADGTSVTKSITFHIVDALSVQTGDTNPIIPLILAAAAALAAIIAVVVIRKRKN